MLNSTRIGVTLLSRRGVRDVLNGRCWEFEGQWRFALAIHRTCENAKLPVSRSVRVHGDWRARSARPLREPRRGTV